MPVDTDREIAKLANVSHDTVAKTKKILAHADEETKTALRAGKTTVHAAYKATTSAEKKSSNATKRKIVKDKAGHVLPEWLEPAFPARSLENLIAKVKALQKEINATAYGDEYGYHLYPACEDDKWRHSDLQKMIEDIQAAKPYAVCPRCEGSGEDLEKTDEACSYCSENGWITKSEWELVPEDEKAAFAEKLSK